MIKQIIVYVGVFLLTLYCFFLYDDVIVTLFLVIEVVYLLVSLLSLFYLNGKVDVAMDTLIPIAEKNQEIPITFTVKNRSKNSRVYVKVLVKIENSFTREKKVIKKSGVIKKNQAENLIFMINAKSCGNLVISMKEYWVYDVLGILKWKKKKKEVQQVGILPECHLIPLEISRKTREFIADAEEYSDRESGDDSSEIYQIREYREKDSLHDIHWKLSAKADKLLVKEYGRPLGCVVLIWLNLQCDFKKRKIVPITILELAASLSLSLLEEKCVHMVVWYEEENKKIQKKRISKEENVYELLSRLLYITAYKENIDNQYEEAFKGTDFSTIVEIQVDGKVLINKEEKMTIVLEENKIKWDELYFTM